MSRIGTRFTFSGDGITFAVRALILACAAVFAGQLVFDIGLGDGSMFYPPGGRSILRFIEYSNVSVMRGWVWTPLTYIFLHAGLWHLFINMVQLYFFGPDVERLLGTRQFVWFFMFCGVVGALANFIPHALGLPDAAIFGASGAILGVLVAFAVNDPDRQLFMLPLPFPITARAMVLVLLILNVIEGLQPGGPISVTTHLGGMAAGFAFMKLRPMTLRWSWERRGRRTQRVKRQAGAAEPAEKGDEKKLADAIDNIFRFRDREKH